MYTHLMLFFFVDKQCKRENVTKHAPEQIKIRCVNIIQDIIYKNNRMKNILRDKKIVKRITLIWVTQQFL